MQFSKGSCAPSLFLALALCGTVAVPAASAQASTNLGSASAGSNSPQDRSVSLKQLPGNILADQKDVWLLPVKLAHGEHFWPTIGVLGVTSAFVASDAHAAPPFRTTDNFSAFNRVFSSTNSAALIAAVPAVIYSVGWLQKDSYAEHSALLAAEAVADGFLLDLPPKATTARRQPLAYVGNGPYVDASSMARTIRFIPEAFFPTMPWRPRPSLPSSHTGIASIAGFPSSPMAWLVPSVSPVSLPIIIFPATSFSVERWVLSSRAM
jgi:hypothetical protein